MSLDAKYLPEKILQINTVETQIAEARSIAYRLTLEIREGLDSGEKNKVEEAEINLKRMTAKLDLLFEVEKELKATPAA